MSHYIFIYELGCWSTVAVVSVDTRNAGNSADPWHSTPGTSYTDREYHPSIPLWIFVCNSLHAQMSIVIHSGLVSLAAQTSLAWAVHQDSGLNAPDMHRCICT
jgi:hypothetical protein